MTRRLSWPPMRSRQRARAGALAAALAAAAIGAGSCRADNPDLGGYTQPAPNPVQEKHAADVTNKVLKREGSAQRVASSTLRDGVVLPGRPAPRNTHKSANPVVPGKLAGAGLRLIDERPRTGIRGSRVAFMHPRATGGVLTEIVQPAGGEDAHR